MIQSVCTDRQSPGTAENRLGIMEWLGENGIPFSIIFTKADKLKGGRLKMNINNYLRELSKEWEELPRISYLLRKTAQDARKSSTT